MREKESEKVEGRRRGNANTPAVASLHGQVGSACLGPVVLLVLWSLEEVGKDEPRSSHDRTVSQFGRGFSDVIKVGGRANTANIQAGLSVPRAVNGPPKILSKVIRFESAGVL